MDKLAGLSTQLGERLQASQNIMVTAESCTGGGVATAITDIAGSSAWFDRAFITYSNEAKVEMLGVKEQTLETYGAVSEETVAEVAQGALNHSNGTISASISGIAGPSGGSPEKPVGMVCFGFISQCGWRLNETCYFDGDRTQVRQQAVEHVLTRVYHYLDHTEANR
ncbi:C-terminal domain of CinA type S [Vibrio astriarenae]|nr:C-terminal domain of CinA type S [Vibrio sp. C7]